MAIHAHPYPLLFASLGGAHLYGFPSADSDWDLRRGHLLPLRGVPALGKLGETHELACDDGTVELDLITHDARKLSWSVTHRSQDQACDTILPNPRS